MPSQDLTDPSTDIEAESDPPKAPRDKRSPSKRTGWLKRALGLGALALVLAGALWQWFRPVDTVSLVDNGPKPIRQKAPSSDPAAPPPGILPSRGSSIVPLVNKVPQAPVEKQNLSAPRASVVKQTPPEVDPARAAPSALPIVKEPAASDGFVTPPALSNNPKSTVPEPKPPPIVQTEYPYSVLLGSFRSLDVAENALSNYGRKGLPVYRVTVDLGEDGTWHRLFAGYFEHAQDAEALIAGERLEGALVKRTRFAAGMGVFQSAGGVAKQLEPLRNHGFSPYIIEDGPQQYRLMVGAFYTEQGAVQQVDELAKNGFVGQVVER